MSIKHRNKTPVFDDFPNSILKKSAKKQREEVLTLESPVSLIPDLRTILSKERPWIVTDKQERIRRRDTLVNDTFYYFKRQYESDCVLILVYCQDKHEYEKVVFF